MCLALPGTWKRDNSQRGSRVCGVFWWGCLGWLFLNVVFELFFVCLIDVFVGLCVGFFCWVFLCLSKGVSGEQKSGKSSSVFFSLLVRK